MGTVPLLAVANQPAGSPIYTVLAALLSGAAAVLITYVLTRKSQKLVMEKTRQEITKLRRENEEGQEEVQARLSRIEDNIPSLVEEVLYDSTTRGKMLGFDLAGRGGQIWTRGANAQAVGPPGEGELSFIDDVVVNIERFNTGGRFEVAFHYYQQDGSGHEIIRKRLSTSGARHFTVTFDAKVSRTPHTLRLTLRQASEGGVWESESRATIDSRTWTAKKFFLKADPSVDCWLRIDDQDVADAPSSIQLRNLRLVEAVSRP